MTPKNNMDKFNDNFRSAPAALFKIYFHFVSFAKKKKIHLIEMLSKIREQIIKTHAECRSDANGAVHTHSPEPIRRTRNINFLAERCSTTININKIKVN